MALQSKTTVYLAIVGVFVMMGGIIFYASLDNSKLEQVGIELTNIEFLDENIKDVARFNVTFLVNNPSDTTFTVSIIQYDLYADGILLGSGKYSTEDVSMPGRASFFPDTEIPLKNIFVLNKSEVGPEIFQDVIDGSVKKFTTGGVITTQTTWSTIEKEFKSEF